MKGPAIVASVLGADYARLGHEVAELEAAGVDRIQWDIMDGRFVPNLSFGADVVAACRPHATVPFEAHLMVEGPDQWLQPFAAAGCDTVLVHLEACRHLHRTLSRIRTLGGAVRGRAERRNAPRGCPPRPRPGRCAPRHDREPRLRRPGLPGDHEVKVAEARRLIARSGLATLIEVDGGISAATAPRAWGESLGGGFGHRRASRGQAGGGGGAAPLLPAGRRGALGGEGGPLTRTDGPGARLPTRGADQNPADQAPARAAVVAAVASWLEPGTLLGLGSGRAVWALIEMLKSRWAGRLPRVVLASVATGTAPSRWTAPSPWTWRSTGPTRSTAGST